MDLFAYSQLDNLKHILEDNAIDIPRLRGIRKMDEEKEVSMDFVPDEDVLPLKTFNKYVGREDVLMVHARIGGNNWESCGGPELEKQPWFIEKVDDGFDSTYCDIYVKIGG